MAHHGHTHDHDQQGHEPTLEEQRAELTAAFWDDRYGSTERVWSGRPNQRLVEQVTGLEPGRALDVACGEGGDALWLAEQGWTVTAVDVSEVALKRVAEHAVERGVDDRVEVGLHDVMDGSAPPAPAAGDGYDLVAAHFLHVLRDDFDDVYRRIASVVAPGGRLLVVGHHPQDVATGVRRSHGVDRMFEPEQVVAALGAGEPGGEWAVEVAETQDRVQQTDDGPMELRDTVVRLRRAGGAA